MSKIFITTYNSPAGPLLIGDLEGKLCLMDWTHRQHRTRVDQRILKYFKAVFADEGMTLLHQSAIRQLNEYFTQGRQYFDVPLLYAGTAFQKSVWEALLAIPYGQTMTYLELSQQLGDAKAVRAVASANAANAISIIVPCHRVVGGQGSLVGYAGGLPAKQALLKLESKTQQSELF